MADARKLLYFGFEIVALVAYHIPLWLVSAMQIWLYEDRKGNWTFARHMRVQMRRHILNVFQK